MNLDGPVAASAGERVVNIGLLSGADTAVDGCNQLATEQFEDDHPGARIEHLLHGGAFTFVARSLSARSL